MVQGPGKSRTSRDEKVRIELHRVRNTFSFRLGLLLTESFIRKPWLLPLLPIRFIALFFHKSTPYKLSSEEKDKQKVAKSILLFSTSEEGMASIERCEEISKQFVGAGEKVIILSTSIHANRLIDNEVPVFTLPDPKSSSSINTKEWNDTCLDLIVSIVDGNAVGTIIFDGPYPYRGVLNALDVYPEIHSVWKRPAYSPAKNPEQISRFDVVENDWLDTYSPKVIDCGREPDDSHMLNLLMGLGYNKRNGVAKRTPAVISQLKRLPKMRVSIPEHLALSDSAFGLTSISRLDSLTNHSEI